MHALHAGNAGQDTPTNDEARDAPHAAGPIDQHWHPQSAARAERDQRDKAIATATARGALAGFELHLIHNECGRPVFLLSR